MIANGKCIEMIKHIKFILTMRFICPRCGRFRVRGGWYDLCPTCESVSK